MKGLPSDITVDLPGLLSRWGIENIKVIGKEIQCFCPFHEDSTPSMFVNTVTGYWHCFGCESNGSKGNIVTLVKKLDKCDEITALRKIIQYSTDIDIPYFKETMLAKLMPKPEEPIYYSMSKYWQEGFSWHVNGLKYLTRKRHIHPAISRMSCVGYDIRGNIIVIPVYDQMGRVICLIRRYIDQKAYRYSKGVDIHNHLYQLRRPNADTVVLVEGAIDALRVESFLYRYNQSDMYAVAAILGSRISKMQMLRLSTEYRNVILMLDNDDAGKFGLHYFIRAHRQAKLGMSMYTIQYPKDIKDPGQASDRQLLYMMESRQFNLKLLANRLVF